ncbi:MAG: leucyl aminopeptidase [Terriglobales bacterium]
MKTNLSFSSPAQIECECLAVVVLDGGEANQPKPQLQATDEAIIQAAQEVTSSGETSGKLFETVMLHRPQGLNCKRLLLVGGGSAKSFSAYELRKVAGTAVRFLKPKGIRSLACLAPTVSSGPADAVKSIAEGALVGDFDPDFYKSDRKKQQVESLTVIMPADSDRTALEKALTQGRIMGESQILTRDLVNEPSNRMTPSNLADRAKRMADEVGLQCEVFGAEKMRELKMGAFLSVAQGSEEEPRLILLRYEPKGAPKTPVIALVGKGITFDTGGISIKPAEGMEKMKYDMAGGATMLGAMAAIALLRPNVRVIAIVCATENMPSGKAQKPGDVQIAMSGKSIEVINTDAEGRLVLADGLHWARELGATHLIDAATLTGAVVVALGHVNAGVFANDDAMYARFAQAQERAGEKMWRLPLDGEYQEQLRSNIADLANVGGRWGGAINAAMFLKEFVGDTPWIHLDIAGTAWVDENKPWIAKGPSGIALRSIVEFVCDMGMYPES